MRYYIIAVIFLLAAVSFLARVPRMAFAEEKSTFCITTPVLMYHHIQPHPAALVKKQELLSTDPYWLDQHISYLQKNNYTIYGVGDLVSSLSLKIPLSGKPVILTFDDAYDDFYIYAYPTLNQYGVHADLMIPTGLIGTTGYLSWNQVKEMQDSGLVSMYNHTVTHYGLGYFNDTDRISYEILHARDQIEQILGIPSTIVAYPYGSYSNRAIDLLKKHGYIAAFTTDHSFIQCDDEMYQLHRNHVGNAPLTTIGL